MSEATPVAPRPRIQGLSDLIFGLALSIGAFLLVGGGIPQDSGKVVRALVAFAFSFLILINVWLRYSTIASVVPVETIGMVRLNMLLLFLVAIEPYLFNVLASVPELSSQLGQDVSAYFGLDIAGMNLVTAYFIHLATREEKRLLPSGLIGRFRISRNFTLMTGLIFAVSAIPFFATTVVFGTSLRIAVWIVSIPIVWLSRVFSRTTR